MPFNMVSYKHVVKKWRLTGDTKKNDLQSEFILCFITSDAVARQSTTIGFVINDYACS